MWAKEEKMKKALTRGMIREDGKVFFGYNGGRPVWYPKELFDKKHAEVKSYQKEYVQACIKEFNKHPHPPLYSYSPTTQLYYVGRVGVKERWVTFEKIQEMRKVNNRSTKNYIKRCRSLDRLGHKPGDVNPDNKELYLTRYVGNKPIWKNLNDYNDYMERKKNQEQQSQCKRRIRRLAAIKNIKNKISRGTNRDEKLFWDYDSYGREIWLDPKEYQRRYEQSIVRQRNYRKRRSERKNQKA